MTFPDMLFYFYMVSEADKHRAITIQIAGFALMTPFGNIILNIYGYELFKYGLVIFSLYLLFTLFLFYLGIICLLRSIEILMESEKR